MKHEKQRIRGVHTENDGYGKRKITLITCDCRSYYRCCCCYFYCCWLTPKAVEAYIYSNSDTDFAMRRNVTFFTLRPRFRYAPTPCLSRRRHRRHSSFVSHAIFVVLCFLLKSQYILQYFVFIVFGFSSCKGYI